LKFNKTAAFEIRHGPFRQIKYCKNQAINTKAKKSDRPHIIANVRMCQKCKKCIRFEAKTRINGGREKIRVNSKSNDLNSVSEYSAILKKTGIEVEGEERPQLRPQT
jgi:hypothetical protein